MMNPRQVRIPRQKWSMQERSRDSTVEALGKQGLNPQGVRKALAFQLRIQGSHQSILEQYC